MFSLRGTCHLPDTLTRYQSLESPRKHARDTLHSGFLDILSQIPPLTRKNWQQRVEVETTADILRNAGLDERLIAVLFEENQNGNGKAKIRIVFWKDQLHLKNVRQQTGIFLEFEQTSVSRDFKVGTSSRLQRSGVLHEAEDYIDRGFQNQDKLETVAKHFQIGKSILNSTRELLKSVGENQFVKVA